MGRTSIRGFPRAIGWLGAAAVFAFLACSDSSGPEECPGNQTVRLHVVNISNLEGLTATASYGGQTCGPVVLPVSDNQGIELAQLLIEGQIGSVISVTATGPGGPATVSCRITDAAASGTNRLQTFVDVTVGPPIIAQCAEGLEPA